MNSGDDTRGPGSPTPSPSPDKNARQRAAAGSSPEATYDEVDRLMGVVHDIGSILDGSLRYVGLARKSLVETNLALSNALVGDAARQLTAAADGLERMAEMVHAAMQGKNQALGSPNLSRARPVTLGEAINHAADVLRPLAGENRVQIDIDAPKHIGELPSGALYTVILNGIQNAVESVARRGGSGRVLVTVRPDEAPKGRTFGRDDREWFCLDIEDDGEGPPPGDSGRVFNLGFSTKPRGTGIGLAVARSVVQGMNGSIELMPALKTAGKGPRGAVLRIRFPAPTRMGEMRLGGAA